MKTCTKCRKRRTLSRFVDDKRYLSGKSPVCLPCRNERMRKRAQVRNKERRQRVIAKYGGVCECCGEATVAFLQIDHVLEDGAEHRRQMGGSYGVFRWLDENPADLTRFRVLCCNCNRAEYSEPDGCPHREGRE